MHRAYWPSAAAMLAALAVIGFANARSYPPILGYDAAEHITYANELVRGGRIPGPQERSEYYTPPLFYALAGTATVLGEQLGFDPPEQLAQLLNVLYMVGTGVLVLVLARLLWPERRLLHVGALGFYSFLPVVFKTGAMFHPETLDVLLTAVAVVLATRMLRRRDFGFWSSALLGLTLGAGQLVRAFSLWTFAAVVLVFLAAAILRVAARRAVLASLGVTMLATAVLAGPWYVRQATRYANPVFDRPTPSTPLWERRPASFYVDLGLPHSLTAPYRSNFVNRVIPETYSELWGDWLGNFAWNQTLGSAPPRRRLALQNRLGLVPTVLALTGWLALLGLALRSPRERIAQLPVAILPGIGLAGYLYFTVAYPTPDGDVLKASYLLTTAPAWAITFGFALDRLARGRARAPLLVFLAASLLLELPFLVYGDATGGR